MKIDGWRYYNHVAVPATPPDTEVNLAPLKNGTIWKIDGGHPLLACWTTDWHCGYETTWWYIIGEKPFFIESLSRKSRWNVRKGLKNCRVERINSAEYSEDIWRVFCEAGKRYKNYSTTTHRESFINNCRNSAPNMEYWGTLIKSRTE